jgi:hypothetical protein
MNRELLERLEAPFAAEQIRQREGEQGQLLDYVETHCVIARLNEALAGDWSFEIVECQLREEISEVMVLGRLSTGNICKMQFGSAKLKRQRSGGELVCLGDDVKAAASDALKKCATLLGVGLHLYRHREPAAENAPGAAAAAARTPPAQGPARPSAAARLSPKQHQLLRTLAGECGLSGEALSARCQQQYGRVLEQLTKANASHLIDALFAAKLQAA